MERSGERVRTQHGGAPPRFKKSKLIVPADLILYLQAPVEIDQIRTAPQQHVLAVVDGFACSGMLIRGSPSTKKWTAFENCDIKSAFSQSAARGQSGQPAAYDRNFQGFTSWSCGMLRQVRIVRQARRLMRPLARIASFSEVLRPILPVKTSNPRLAIFSRRRPYIVSKTHSAG